MVVAKDGCADVVQARAFHGPVCEGGGGVLVMLCFAAAGYVLAAFGYSLVFIIIAFFLGPRFEISLAQSVALTNGDPARIVDYPVAIALLVLSVISVIYLLRRGRMRFDSENDSDSDSDNHSDRD